MKSYNENVEECVKKQLGEHYPDTVHILKSQDKYPARGCNDPEAHSFMGLSTIILRK